MDQNEISRTELVKQRRLLVMISLAIIAVPILRVTISGGATFSGVSILIERSEFVSVCLLAIWLWALLRYYLHFRRRIELVSFALRQEHEIVEERMRSKWAYGRAKLLAGYAGIEPSSYDMLKIARNLDTPEMPRGVLRYEGFLSHKGRTIVGGTLWFEMPPSVLRRISLRGWIVVAFTYPAVSEHLAPYAIAVGAAIALLIGFEWPWSTTLPPVNWGWDEFGRH